MQDHFNQPYGGQLVSLLPKPEQIFELLAESLGWPSWDLNSRQLCNLELLTTGGFLRLPGFMSRADDENTSPRTNRSPEGVRGSR